MREKRKAERLGVLALWIGATAHAVAIGPSTAPPQLERVSPPRELGPALRAAVENQSVPVTLPSGGTLRVWPARRVRAAKPSAAGESGFLRDRVRLSIEPGSLVGVARWGSSWLDYRDQRIPAGTYALIYVVQPAFKQHVGVSEFRDAVLLVIPNRIAAGRGVPDLVAASRDVSGTSHPAVAALFPVDPNTALPRLVERADGGLTLEFRAGAFRIGFAVSGKGNLHDTEP